MTARKYEFLTDGSEALIAQFVKEPSEEAALKVFNEVSRHNTLSSNELKNIAIDEIRKEIQTLATKDELKLSHDSIHDRLSSIENRFESRFLSMEDKFLSMENRFSSMEDKFEDRFLSMEDKFENRFLSMEDRFLSVENRLSSMEDKFENRFLSMEDRFLSVENRLSSMEDKFENRFLSMEEQIKTLATKDELKLTNDRLTDLQKQITNMQGQMTTMATKDELKAEIKASSANVIKWVVSVQIATIASIVVILKLFLNY